MVTSVSCDKCESEISDGHKSIKCDLCKNVFHIQCVSITAKSLELIMKTKSIHWFCDKCDSENLVKEFSEFRELKSRYAELYDKLENLTRKVDENSRKIMEANETVPTNYERIVSTIMEETSQQEQRKFNICVFGLEEGETEDKDSFENICTARIGMARDDIHHQIESVHRVGRPQANKTRPLIIKTKSIEMKSRLIRDAQNLKDYNISIRPRPPIIFAPDLTKLQQEERNKLRVELKRRKDANEDVIIRGGKVIQRPNGTQNTGVRTRAHSSRQNH